MDESEKGYISSKNLFCAFTNVLPYLIIIAIIAGISFAFVIGRPDFAIRGLVVAIPGVIASIILIMNRKRNVSLVGIDAPFNRSQMEYMILFTIFYLISLTILFTSTDRPWYYLLCVTIMNIIILFQIFSKNINKNIVLAEMFLSCITVTYSVTLKYPLYFGGTDILLHLFMSEVTYLSGHTIPNSLSIGYSSFPLFHILISQAAYLLNISTQMALFIVTAPIYAISVFFVYYIFMRLTANMQLALLSTLLFSNLSVVNYYGMYMVTRTLAFIGFLIMLYLIYKKNTGHDVVYKFLVILLGIFIILVHQVSTPQILAVIMLLFISEKIMAKTTELKEQYINYNYIILFAVMFLTYWFQFAFLFSRMVVKSRVDSLATDTIIIKESVKVGNEWIFLSQNIDTIVITFLILMGICAILFKYRNEYYAVLAIVSLLVIPIFIPNPLQTLWQTMTLFRFDRFMLLVSPFIAFSMAAGVIYFYNLLVQKKWNKELTFLLVVSIIALFIIPSLMSNNPEANDYSIERKYFTNGELNGFRFLFDYVPSGSAITSDYSTLRYFPDVDFEEAKPLALSYYRTNTVADINNVELKSGYFILRNEHLLEHGLYLDPFTMLKLSKSDVEVDTLNSELNTENKIYSNFKVEVYKDKTI